MRRWMIVAALVAVSGTVRAEPDLQITEIWPGGIDGAEFISDWFEVTNFGDMAATNLDGNIYYDDSSDLPTEDSPLVGIDTIERGESVIYLVSWEDFQEDLPGFTAQDAVDRFGQMWGSPNGDLSNVQIGWVVGGAGLGGGSDAVNIFDGNSESANTIDREQYVGTALASWVSQPDGVLNFPLDAAQPGVWRAYAGNLPASDEPGIGPAIGSPGTVGVPEPASVVTALIAALGVACLRRRR